MQELIKISQELIGAETVNSVNARELYETLEIKKEFATWIKSQIKSLGLEENIDYITFNTTVKRKTGASIRKEYIITTDTAKHISMASRTAKGKEVRTYFIAIEKEFIKDLQNTKAYIAGGYKSQLSQKNKKIRELEAKLLLLESEADKVDYRLKAKALYPIILNRIEKIEAEFSKEFAGQSLQVYKNLLEEIVKLLSREARVSRFMTFFGNGSAVNNEVIEDDRRTLTFGK